VYWLRLEIAVGLSTYSNLKDIQQNTEKSVKTLLADAERDLAELRADYPAIGHMNHTIDTIVVELQSMFLDWDSARYDQMGEPEKQQVLLAEFTFNGLRPFVHHRPSTARHKIGLVNRGFGLFYAARYAKTPKDNLPDFHRSVLYLRRAAEDSDQEESVAAFKDLGVLLTRHSVFVDEIGFATGPNIKEAEGYFRMALLKNDLNPGSLGGVAWIQKRTNRLPEAVLCMSKIIDNKALSDKESRRYLWKAYVNRACYLTLLSEGADQKLRLENFNQALSDLKTSCDVAQRFRQKPEQIESIKKEVSTGDLIKLREHFPHKIQRMLQA
jgi:hypothetical protein